MGLYSEEQQKEFVVSMRETAQETLTQLQEATGLRQFGDNEASLRALDQFADIYSAQPDNKDAVTSGYIIGVGTLLGDLLIQKYGGRWVIDRKYSILSRNANAAVVELFPYFPAELRLKGNKKASIFNYYYEEVPRAFNVAPAAPVATAAVPPAAEHPVLKTIRKNSAYVIENFGKRNNIADFGFNTASVAFLDRYITQKINATTPDATKEQVMNLFGAFLGECLVSEYQASWQINNDGQPRIALGKGGTVHFLDPFGKIAKRIVNGKQDSLAFYFSEFIPQVLASAS